MNSVLWNRFQIDCFHLDVNIPPSNNILLNRTYKRKNSSICLMPYYTISFTNIFSIILYIRTKLFIGPLRCLSGVIVYSTIPYIFYNMYINKSPRRRLYSSVEYEKNIHECQYRRLAIELIKNKNHKNCNNNIY